MSVQTILVRLVQGQPWIVQSAQFASMQGQPVIVQTMQQAGTQSDQSRKFHKKRGAGMQARQAEPPVIVQPKPSKRQIVPNPLEQSIRPQGHITQDSQILLVNQSIPGEAKVPETAGKPVRTLPMRYYSFAELGLLFLIFILSIVSLSTPS